MRVDFTGSENDSELGEGGRVLSKKKSKKSTQEEKIMLPNFTGNKDSCNLGTVAAIPGYGCKGEWLSPGT